MTVAERLRMSCSSDGYLHLPGWEADALIALCEAHETVNAYQPPQNPMVLGKFEELLEARSRAFAAFAAALEEK